MFTDTILNTSAIHLFGLILDDLKLRKRAGVEKPPRLGANGLLQQQLNADGSQLARIYGFAFEAQFYELPKPTILLVHGTGTVVDFPAPSVIDAKVLSRSPSEPSLTGLASQLGSFARGMRVWIYDKNDLSLRLEAETGTLEDILLSAELDLRDRGSLGRSGGAFGRSGGALGRSGGAMGRSGGVMNRGGRGDLD